MILHEQLLGNKTRDKNNGVNRLRWRQPASQANTTNDKEPCDENVDYKYGFLIHLILFCRTSGLRRDPTPCGGHPGTDWLLGFLC